MQLSGFEIAPTPQLVVDAERTLVAANLAARTLLHLSDGDVGRPLKDLEASYRPVELRAAVDRVLEERHALTLDPVDYTSGGEPRALRVTLAPLPAAGGIGGVSIAFVDATAERRLAAELEQTKVELGAAYEELQSTVEELETTNEELQSTNEELETTNEELQSTNEELETMNEELQSSNEELETTNEELRVRSTQLSEANAFMESILAGMGVGVIVLDREQRVRIWNKSSEDLWGVRADEAAGTHVLELDFGLPVRALQSALRATAGDGAETQVVEVEATDRRGRPFVCEVTVVPLGIQGDEGRSTIILARRDGAVA